MRAIIALASVLLAGPSLADSVRHLSVPERFWGTWAPSAELCRDNKSVITVSPKGYTTAQSSCAIQWVTETAGADRSIYSAHMRCTLLSGPQQEPEEVNRIIIAKADGEVSAGPDFHELRSLQRCPVN
jgi:hypothetical protein